MKLNQDAAMVVFSGGQDSTTCLGWALDTFSRVECVTFNYGQKHAIELEAAKNVISFFERRRGHAIFHEIVNIGPIFAGMSPLTNPSKQLETYANHRSMADTIGDRVEKTFVPMRNAVFLMLAANRAAVAGCGNLVTGVCQADNANYPDCRQVFVSSADDTINAALGTEDTYSAAGQYLGMTIQTPLMDRTKAETIQLALETPHTYEALKWSHTAYDGVYPPTGKDHASVLRAYGFEQANVPDPLVLRAWAEGLMELPSTPNYEGAQEFMAEWVEPLK